LSVSIEIFLYSFRDKECLLSDFFDVTLSYGKRYVLRVVLHSVLMNSLAGP
jgi:hypothetical protein